MQDSIWIDLKTPRELKKQLPKKYRKELGFSMTCAKELRPVLFFVKKCLEDGFKDNGASALVQFIPHLVK